MDRVCTISMVDEAHNSFTPLLHLESRSRNGSIVTNVSCFLARIALNINRFDIDLVVINVVVRPDMCKQNKLTYRVNLICAYL